MDETKKTEANPPASEPADAAEGPGRGRSIALFVVLPLLATIVAVVLTMGEQKPNTSVVFRGEPAPPFAVTGFNPGFEGKEFSSESLRGQIVVLNFWAEWCAECKKEMHALEEAWKTYRDRGVVVLGIDYRDFDEKALAMLEAYGISYPNGPDRRSEIADRYHVSGVPETVFIDREGNVHEVAIGPLSRPRLHRVLGEMLAVPAAG